MVALVALVATTVPSLLVLVLDRDDAPRERWERLASASILSVQDVIYDPRWQVFIVDEPQGPIALYAVSPHDPTGEERVLFCPSSGWFEGQAHGEMFDRRGIHADGPGTRGMYRLDVRVQEDAVEVNLGVVYTGIPAGQRRADAARGPSCASRGWVESPPGFLGPPATA